MYPDKLSGVFRSVLMVTATGVPNIENNDEHDDMDFPTVQNDIRNQ